MQTEMIPLVLPLAFLAVCALAGEVLIGTRKAGTRDRGRRISQVRRAEAKIALAPAVRLSWG